MPLFGNLSPISERVNDSTQNTPVENVQPEQNLTPSLPPIVNLSPTSESVKNQTYNTLTETNLPEQNSPSVVRDIPHPHALISKNLPGVIIPDHNVQPKLKSQEGLTKNSVVLCPRIYIYHDELRRHDLMEESMENIGPYTYGI